MHYQLLCSTAETVQLFNGQLFPILPKPNASSDGPSQTYTFKQIESVNLHCDFMSVLFDVVGLEFTVEERLLVLELL